MDFSVCLCMALYPARPGTPRMWCDVTIRKVFAPVRVLSPSLIHIYSTLTHSLIPLITYCTLHYTTLSRNTKTPKRFMHENRLRNRTTLSLGFGKSANLTLPASPSPESREGTPSMKVLISTKTHGLSLGRTTDEHRGFRVAFHGVHGVGTCVSGKRHRQTCGVRLSPRKAWPERHTIKRLCDYSAGSTFRLATEKYQDICRKMSH